MRKMFILVFLLTIFSANAEPFEPACLKNTLESTGSSFTTNMSPTSLQKFYQRLAVECPVPSKPFRNDNLAYKGSFFFSTREKVGAVELGGLSSLAYDPNTDIIYSVSDQRRLGSNLLFRFKMKQDPNFKISEVLSPITIRPEFQKTFYDTDLEGSVIDRDGNFILSSESLFAKDSGYLKVFSPEGTFLRNISLPKKFYSHWLFRKGLQRNKGFEGLTISTDARFIFTSNEEPLLQDIRSSGEKIIRIVKIDNQNEKSTREYAYQLEDDQDYGVSEILAVNSDELLVLERSYNYVTKLNSERIFKVDLRRGADVSKISSLEKYRGDLNEVLLKKELFVDLNQIVDSLPAGLRRLDNLEGMSWGPKTSTGNKTLLLVSDNNLNPSQITQFIFLEVLK